jgi:tetratricopeptide (TPR) repeat protein
MKTTVWLLAAALASLLPFSAGHGQTARPEGEDRSAPEGEYQMRIEPGRGSGTAFAWRMPASRVDDRSDAGYALYKEGYALVLEEKYDAARKKFEELIAKYPASSYADDARYWTAYSLRSSDREKAIEDYGKFIREHPRSTYFDDAVADLNALQAGMPEIPEGAIAPLPPGLPRRPTAVAIGPNTGNLLRQLKREMRHMSRTGVARSSPAPFARWGEEEKLDEGTRLKMDALYALGETKEDDRSFSTLRDVALDMRQVHPLREAAMDALSGFTRHDALSVFVEIARKDTSADLQGFAVDYIGEHGTDKNQRVTVLEDLFRTLPKSRAGQRRTIVYTIADVGNDRAVDFLKRVALADGDYDLRRDAVYYLGSIGGENARAALYEILKGH